VALSNPTGGAIVDDRNSTGVTIFEGTGTFDFTTSDYRVAENNAGFTVTVTLTGALNGPETTVDYLVYDGTARTGADYGAISGTLTFDPSLYVQTITQTFTIPIFNDLLTEADETIFLTLSNPTDGASIGERGTATLTILDEDPSSASDEVSAGGPYAILEGDLLELSASVLSGTATDFTWDVNGDGVFGDAVGQNPTLTWAQLNALGIVDGPSTFEVQVRAVDSQGQPITSATTPLTVGNASPTAVFGDSGPVPEGTPTTVAFSDASDPSVTDQAAGFLYSYDFNNDGDFTDDGEATDVASASHSFNFAEAGTYTIHGRIEDKDGGYNDYYIDVTVSAVMPPPAVADVRVRFGSQSYSLIGNDRILPWTNISAVDITFSQDVVVDANDLRLSGINVRQYGGTFSYDGAKHTATWKLASAIEADRLTLSLDGDGPSGDGNDGIKSAAGAYLQGGDVALGFRVLAGDYNGDGVVTIQDSVAVRDHSPGYGQYQLWADLDGDGDVDIDDINAPRRRLGKRLPP
jgi:hypothetical protein